MLCTKNVRKANPYRNAKKEKNIKKKTKSNYDQLELDWYKVQFLWE